MTIYNKAQLPPSNIGAAETHPFSGQMQGACFALCSLFFGDFLRGILLSFTLYLYATSAQNRAANVRAVFDVMKYGAKGNGKTLDSPAFLKAWERACSSNTRFPLLLIPRGNFLLKAVQFSGPCNASAVGVKVLGNIISSPHKSHWPKCTDFISFDKVNNLTLNGPGTIDGNGHNWWDNKLSCGGDRPTNLAFNACNGVSLRGIHSKNSARNHLSISRVNHAIISRVTLTAPHTSPNTDGIDIATSKYITIQNSVIGSGDDCIAINNHCKDIFIYKIRCGPGHGISVGSLGRGGEVAQVENILVSNTTFIRTDNGARIKTWKGGKGYVRNVVYRDIKLIDVRRPIIIDQSYVDQMRPLSNEDSSVKISDVKFINFKGTCNKTDAITLDCSDSGFGCRGVELVNVNIKGGAGEKPVAKCTNANVKAVKMNLKLDSCKGAETLKNSQVHALTLSRVE